MKSSSEVPPLHHTPNPKAQMQQLVENLRADVLKIKEPRAQALFETSAEVLTGLIKAFDDYEQQNEPAWRPESVASSAAESSSHASRR